MKANARTFCISTMSLAVLLAGSSCSKRIRPSQSSKPDYLPISAGAHWNYSGDLSESKRITSNSKIFNGKTYSETETLFNGKTTTGYVFKENGNYYSRGFLGTAGDSLELTILKDNVAAGTNWYDTLATSMVPIAYKFTLDAKDVRSTVNNKTYENVIKVKMEVSFILENAAKLIATEYLSFAPGVGIIQFQTISSKGVVSFSNLGFVHH